jgi:AcrR family transcriptional regulator
MVYRQTERVARKLADRRATILNAACETAMESGMAAIQMSALAERAGVAAGTIYCYFASKTELVAELTRTLAQEEIEALERAANAAPGPLSALAAAIMAFAMRALGRRRLVLALISEPMEPELAAVRMSYREALAGEFAKLIRGAVDAGQLADGNAPRCAPALVGILTDGLIAQLASVPPGDTAKARIEVQQLAVFALRALGVMDARARGLVVQAIEHYPGNWEAVTSRLRW